MDERVESGVYNRALAGTDHYRHNCKHIGSQQQPTSHKHGTEAETTNHSSHTATEHNGGGTTMYEADRDKLRLSGGWEEAVRLSLRTGMERVISELDIQMTEQERVSQTTQPIHQPANQPANQHSSPL